MLSHCRCPEAKTIVACPALPKGGEILKEKLKQEREYWSLYVGHHKAHQLHQGELPHIEPVPPQVSQVLPASARQEKKNSSFGFVFRWILPVFLRIIFTKRAFSLKRLIKYEFRCLHNYYNFCPRTFLHYFFCVFIFELSMGFCKEITNFCGSRTIIN